MPKIMSVEKSHHSEFDFIFDCPGCGCSHGIRTTGEGGPIWGFNGDMEKPTVTPSIRVQHYLEKSGKMVLCHSFITNGMIQFLSDSTHELAGQTVPLEDM